MDDSRHWLRITWVLGAHLSRGTSAELWSATGSDPQVVPRQRIAYPLTKIRSDAQKRNRRDVSEDPMSSGNRGVATMAQRHSATGCLPDVDEVTLGVNRAVPRNRFTSAQASRRRDVPQFATPSERSGKPTLATAFHASHRTGRAS